MSEAYNKQSGALRGIEEALISKIEDQIITTEERVSIDDVVGLDNAKNTLTEWVLRRKNPILFTGLLASPKGLLLFGSPGTGKTMIGKAAVGQIGVTFFSISCVSIGSEWLNKKNNDSSVDRKVKSEFLVQLDEIVNRTECHVLYIGATNRPREIDDAALRRFKEKLYVALPTVTAPFRKNINTITDEELSQLLYDTEGYSWNDLSKLCEDAAMGPIHDLDYSMDELIRSEEGIPPLTGASQKVTARVQPHCFPRQSGCFRKLEQHTW
ncbi:hypothetical protein ACHAWF_016598 [Thalassiosira exigua]